MVNMLNQLQLYIVLGGLTIIFIIIAGAVLYFLQMKKKNDSKIICDYDSFNRKDSLDYVKFDDIISSNEGDILSGAGMIVRNGTEFIGAISVTGWNFYQGSFDEQVNCINATISMFDALEEPITLRQSAKSISIEHNIEQHQKIVEDLRNEIYHLDEEIKENAVAAKDNIDNDDVYNLYMGEAKRLQRTVELKTRQMDEASQLISYMKNISSNSDETQRIQHIVFSYKYDVTQFTATLSKEEIASNAMRELNNRAASLISSLVRCGCGARRCSAAELTDLIRRHMHPVTGDDVSLDELFNSSLNTLFITSDSMLSVVKDKISEERYQEEVAAYEQAIAEALKRQELTAEKQERDRMEVTERVAVDESPAGR